MHYEIVYLPQADSDLDSIAEYLSQFYDGTLKRVFDEFERCISKLRDTPYIYEKYSGNPNFRKISAAGYIIFYKVNEETSTAEIFRVLHGARDIRL